MGEKEKQQNAQTRISANLFDPEANDFWNPVLSARCQSLKIVSPHPLTLHMEGLSQTSTPHPSPSKVSSKTCFRRSRRVSVAELGPKTTQTRGFFLADPNTKHWNWTKKTVSFESLWLWASSSLRAGSANGSRFKSRILLFLGVRWGPEGASHLLALCGWCTTVEETENEQVWAFSSLLRRPLR